MIVVSVGGGLNFWLVAVPVVQLGTLKFCPAPRCG